MNQLTPTYLNPHQVLDVCEGTPCVRLVNMLQQLLWHWNTSELHLMFLQPLFIFLKTRQAYDFPRIDLLTGVVLFIWVCVQHNEAALQSCIFDYEGKRIGHKRFTRDYQGKTSSFHL